MGVSAIESRARENVDVDELDKPVGGRQCSCRTNETYSIPTRLGAIAALTCCVSRVLNRAAQLERRCLYAMTSQHPSYAIHVDIEGTPLPPHPGHCWTRFVCISDTLAQVPRPARGRALARWRFEQLATTIEWLKSLEHPVKM